VYKVASDRRQSSLRHGRLSDWVNGEEWQSAETRLRQMQEGTKIIEARILSTPEGDERRSLGLQKRDLQNEIREFRKAMHMVRQAKRGLEETFMDCAKQTLPRIQFELILKMANRELDRRLKEIEQMPIPETSALTSAVHKD
jgi:hypothetical protein